MSLLADARREIEREVEASVPEGKRAALVFVADEKGGQLVVAAKLGEHWKLEGRAKAEWSQKPNVGGEIRIIGSW